VLAHSIRRHATLPVDVFPLIDLDLPEPKDARQGKRTGFSFSRFAIPQLAGYQGKALYLDADMIVFKDIAELWSIPLEGAKVVIQEEIPEAKQPRGKKGAPARRMKQTAVMLLDCGRLPWDPVKIIEGLDGKYTYEDLVYHLCILAETDIRCAIPFRWNSLETWDESTCLLHYTDMMTQPWASLDNKNGWLWLEEVRLMLSRGVLARQRIEEEIRLGHLRPSLLPELESGDDLREADSARVAALKRLDRDAGFVMHKEVYEAKARRTQAIKEYERRLALGQPRKNNFLAGLLREARRALRLDQ
jgi:lipopolysaccharide biosynthesis glycosyltransferase